MSRYVIMTRRRPQFVLAPTGEITIRVADTLQDARDEARDDCFARDFDADVIAPSLRQAEQLAEHGGTVGPLPDDTMIDVIACDDDDDEIGYRLRDRAATAQEMGDLPGFPVGERLSAARAVLKAARPTVTEQRAALLGWLNEQGQPSSGTNIRESQPEPTTVLEDLVALQLLGVVSRTGEIWSTSAQQKRMVDLPPVEQRERILRTLRQHAPVALRPDRVASLLGLPVATVYDRLGEMRSLGDATSTRGGWWRAAPRDTDEPEGPAER
jgi:hypothetical protein